MENHIEYNGYQGYQALNVSAQARVASSVDLVLMLCEGLLEEIERVRGHFLHQHLEKKGESINRCINILNGLSSALDYESGGEIVTNLARLYDYCIYRLYQASLSLDSKDLDDVIGILTPLVSGWKGLQDQHEDN